MQRLGPGRRDFFPSILLNPEEGVFIPTEQSWGLQGSKSAASLRKASPPLPGSPDGRERGKSF